MFKIQSLYKVLANLSKRERVILYCTVGFFFVFILDRVIISAVFDKIKSLNRQADDMRTEIRKNMRILAYKESISEGTKRYSSLMRSLKSEEEEMTAILREVENLASKSSIYLVDMKPSGTTDMGMLRKYIVDLNCESQMEQLVDFMYNIENSGKLLTIERYTISQKSRDSSIARCRLNISKVCYIADTPAKGKE